LRSLHFSGLSAVHQMLETLLIRDQVDFETTGFSSLPVERQEVSAVSPVPVCHCKLLPILFVCKKNRVRYVLEALPELSYAQSFPSSVQFRFSLGYSRVVFAAQFTISVRHLCFWYLWSSLSMMQYFYVLYDFALSVLMLCCQVQLHDDVVLRTKLSVMPIHGTLCNSCFCVWESASPHFEPLLIRWNFSFQ